MKAFISYSHHDEWALKRLRVHLAMMEREGKIAAWSDTMITPGGNIDKEVVKQLRECDIFIPLVSADFLASFYCYERELAEAIERHEAGEIRIVPVVVEPCDWQGSPLRNFKALPKDAKPISEYANANNAFLEVITGLRSIWENFGGSTEKSAPFAAAVARPAASAKRYRAKKTFDDIDKQDFREAVFAAIREYFKASVEELDAIDGFKGRFTDMKDGAFTCSIVNKGHRRGTAHITVHPGGHTHIGDLYWSNSASAPANTSSGSFSIEHDDYEMYLSSLDFMRGKTGKLSPQQAAEQLWEKFIEEAGISHA
jgi:hypothetical protein